MEPRCGREWGGYTACNPAASFRRAIEDYSLELKMDFRELKLRTSPWIALLLGVIWVLITLIGKRAAVSWRDVYPGVALVGAGFVLFATLRWLDRPMQSRDSEADESPDSVRDA